MLLPILIAVFTNAVTVQWDKSPDANVVGYNVYWYGLYNIPVTANGASISGQPIPINVGNTNSYTISSTDALPWFIAVTGYDANGNESQPTWPLTWNDQTRYDITNYVTFSNPSGVPVLQSHDLVRWTPTNFTSITLTNPEDNQFFAGSGLTWGRQITSLWSNTPWNPWQP